MQASAGTHCSKRKEPPTQKKKVVAHKTQIEADTGNVMIKKKKKNKYMVQGSGGGGGEQILKGGGTNHQVYEVNIWTLLRRESGAAHLADQRFSKKKVADLKACLSKEPPVQNDG
jgi:hypothetical protein